MQFSLSTILVALMATAAVAAPSQEAAEKRSAETKGGKCNGTSCRVGLSNYRCNRGSCVGNGGGDGKRCTVVDNPDKTRTAFCPVGCPDPNLC
ncbi:hypothetical protein F4809DRAFT_641991 [Biscogniauxia mediterranea]|nr:hypothetical protein F4809DRAFT_641991 [Biscogniauxia mediterranea]